MCLYVYTYNLNCNVQSCESLSFIFRSLVKYFSEKVFSGLEVFNFYNSSS